MGKLYNFVRLIKKYSHPFTVEIEKDGEYEGGIYVPGEKSVYELNGAIVPLGERKLYYLGGSYTDQDRDLYMKDKIPDALKQGVVHYKGNTYTIEQETDYDDYANAYIYRLKRVSVNDKS